MGSGVLGAEGLEVVKLRPMEEVDMQGPKGALVALVWELKEHSWSCIMLSCAQEAGQQGEECQKAAQEKGKVVARSGQK